MAAEPLHEVDVETQTGVKTKFRVRAADVEKYRKMSKQSSQQQPPPEPRTSQRQPRAREGDVETR